MLTTLQNPRVQKWTWSGAGFVRKSPSEKHATTPNLLQLYKRARYYDPLTGEFISRDPLGYVDGMSLYRGYFVPGLVDPYGLEETGFCGLWWHYFTWQNAGQPSVDTLDTVLDGGKKAGQVAGGAALVGLAGVAAGPAVVAGTARAAVATKDLALLAASSPGAAASRIAATPYVAEAGVGIVAGAFGMDGPGGVDDLVSSAGGVVSRNIDDLARATGKSVDELVMLLKEGDALFSPNTGGKEIFTVQEHIGDIWSSGRVWGKTEGSVYGMTIPNAPRWRTFINPAEEDPGRIIFRGNAAELFDSHEALGPFSLVKRLVGQQKAGFGDVVFDNAFRAGNEIFVYEARLGSHHGQSSLWAASKLWGRRIGIDGGINGGSAAGAGAVGYYWFQSRNRE